MVVLAERSIETCINNSLSLFRSNLSTFVPDVFAQETSDNQTQITNWWSNANNQVIVQVGYSLTPIKGPQIAITMEPSQEVSSRRFVGNMLQQTSNNYEYGATFDALYAVHVFGPNQNWLLWMQSLVRWSLEMQRQTLESSYGLMNQRLSMGALRPVPDSMKDIVFPFERTVNLSCQHMDTWTPLAGTSVMNANITLNATN